MSFVCNFLVQKEKKKMQMKSESQKEIFEFEKNVPFVNGGVKNDENEAEKKKC
jgi:hypothetical protein